MSHQITDVINRYEQALNTSNAAAALALYGREPIFMAQNAPAFVGRDAVRAGYEYVFRTIKLDVVFTVHEIVELGGELAYVRTTSAGKQEVLATHATSREANNELFIFRLEDGQWKIHRYLFATANPPTAAN